MSKSSITPYVGASSGYGLAALITGGNAIGVGAAGGALGTFAAPFLGVAALFVGAGWALGQAIDACMEKPAERKVIDVTPVVVEVKEVRIPWEYSEVMGTFAHLY